MSSQGFQGHLWESQRFQRNTDDFRGTSGDRKEIPGDHRGVLGGSLESACGFFEVFGGFQEFYVTSMGRTGFQAAPGGLWGASYH